MGKEILQVVESVSNEKGVPPGVIFEALESALAMATKKRYPEEAEVRVEIDRATGDYESFRLCTVVPDDIVMENPHAQIRLDDAVDEKADAQPGDVIEEKVESVEFGRIAAQTAKQVIVQKVREAERQQMVEAFAPKIGQLVSGTVKKVTRDSIIVDLGSNAEAVLPREALIPRVPHRRPPACTPEGSAAGRARPAAHAVAHRPEDAHRAVQDRGAGDRRAGDRDPRGSA
jgi:N utilization substance protein A